jgi:hypothetical protein
MGLALGSGAGALPDDDNVRHAGGAVDLIWLIGEILDRDAVRVVLESQVPGERPAYVVEEKGRPREARDGQTGRGRG